LVSRTKKPVPAGRTIMGLAAVMGAKLEQIAGERNVRTRESALQTKSQSVSTFPVTQETLWPKLAVAVSRHPRRGLGPIRLPRVNP
jgi:hypothetical protein